MRIIEIRPSKRFRHHWEACEGDGVQPTFAGKKDALDYAMGRFGGGSGEIHIYDDAGENIIEKIQTDDRITYPSA